MNRIVVLFLLLPAAAIAQLKAYTADHLHSHNDYEKPVPFREAYGQGFGSIEADIFLQSHQLILAHDTNQLKLGRTLDAVYLQPLQKCIKDNNGYPYSDHAKELQLLIDIKTDSMATLKELIKKLKSYPLIIHCAGVKIVITGNRPPPAKFPHFPKWLYFDGVLDVYYSPKALRRIVMLSDNFRRYASWNGLDTLKAKDRAAIQKLIAKAHVQHKKVRFWNAPDLINSWKILIELGVDYINTDRIAAAALFLRQRAAIEK